MVVDRFTGNQITLFPYFNVIPKIGMGLPKTGGVSFYCDKLGKKIRPLKLLLSVAKANEKKI